MLKKTFSHPNRKKVALIKIKVYLQVKLMLFKSDTIVNRIE